MFDAFYDALYFSVLIHILQKIKEPMSVKKLVQLEYIVNCSPKVLFNRLSTAAGLTEWFADDVRVKGNLFTFFWGGTNEEAEKKINKENKMLITLFVVI